jgi:TonB family protein
LVVGKVNVMMAMTLSSSGQLRELFVVKSSGIPGYDAEALRTIRQSSPFSAPPAKILDKEGTLRMTWNFITYL